MNNNKFFSLLNILYYALLIGNILFIAIAYWIVQSGSMGSSIPQSENILLIAAILVSVLIMASNMIFKKKLPKIQLMNGVQEKTKAYLSIFIIRISFLQSASFIATIFYLLTSNTLLLALAGLIAFLFLTIKPSKKRIIFELKLTQEEATKFININKKTKKLD